jgi:uncharacterized membrane protein
MTNKKVLLVGESWETFSTHIKGFDTFYTSKYEEGAEWLIEALKKAGYEVEFIPNHRASSEFPTSEEEINKYQVLILSDIGANTLLLHPDTFEKSIPTTNRLKLIKKYVENGGGFLMIGGYLSFQGVDGKARYKDTPVEEVLPIEIKPIDDRVEVPEGMYPEVTEDHVITAGLDKKWPMFLGYNQFKAADKAVVLAKSKENNDPFLVAGKFKKGRTAAFASDCAPHWGSKDFIEWDQYDKLWGQLIDWLAAEVD